MRVFSRVSAGCALALAGLCAAGCGNASSTEGGSGGAGVDAGSDAGAGEGTDAGSPDGGGGLAAGCEGVVPNRLGASFTFDVPASSASASCDAVTSDESGNLAASAGTDPRGIQDWHLFDPKGAHLSAIRATDLFPQGPGYEGLGLYTAAAGDEFLRVKSWAPDGKETAGPPVSGSTGDAKSYRAWPNGLFVVAPSCTNPAAGGRLDLRLFDSGTNEKASATVPGCERLISAVVDANQNWLLVLQGGPSIGFGAGDLIGQWFDSAGRSLTGWFRVAPLTGTHSYLLHALIGGGAALQIDGAWSYLLPSGKNQAQAAPEWLSSHPQADFTLVRGARAYAVLPRSGDTTQMDLYSAAGNRCGSVKFPERYLTTGADGSVIASSGDRGCTKTVWPGLLR